MAVDDQVFRNELNIAGTFDQPSLEEWHEIAERALKGISLDELSTTTHEGLVLKPLYTSVDTSSAGTVDRAGRGRAGQPWEVCQQYRHPDPIIAGSQMAEDAARGVESVWVEFDRRIGLTADLDDSRAADWHRGGVIISTVDDFERLFETVDLTTTGVHLGDNGRNLSLVGALLTAAQRMGVDHGRIRGTLGCDPLGALAADGVLSPGLDRSLAMLRDVVVWAETNAPGTRSLNVSSIPYTLAGATAVHELAFSLATGVEYLRSLVDAGVDLPVATRHHGFRMAIGRDLFMAIAKLRALRRLWARVTAACGGDPNNQTTWIHAITSPRSMTVRDPWVNILRATVESFAAAAGAADAITVLPFDVAIGPSDERARRLAANTHAILRDESNLSRVTEPAAGSWYVERLTDDLSIAAWSMFQQIESQGGFRAALTDGVVHKMLCEALDRKRNAIAAGEDRITGVSSYPDPSEQPLRRDQVDLAGIRDRASRSLVDRSPPTTLLDRVSAQAELNLGDGSIVSAAIAAMSAGATIAEVAAALQGETEETRIEALPAEREEDAVEGISR